VALRRVNVGEWPAASIVGPLSCGAWKYSLTVVTR
jgi:hypothetical protein